MRLPTRSPPLSIAWALLASLGTVRSCQPPTPAFQFSAPSASSYSQQQYSQPSYKQSYSSYTPGYSVDSYQQQVGAAPVAAPPPPPPIPGPVPPSAGGDYSQGLESLSGKLTSGVASGEGTYTGSPPSAYAKYGKAAKHSSSSPDFAPYPGYVPPPPGPEDTQYPAPAAPAGHSYQPPTSFAGLAGLQIPGAAIAAGPQPFPQLVQTPAYQQVQYPMQQQQQFSSYVPQQQQQYAQNLVPGQLFNNGHSMVPHYQQVAQSAAAAPPPPQSAASSDCSSLSLGNFPTCVENRAGISTSASGLACTFEAGTTCRFDASSLNIASMPNPTTRAAFSRLMGRSETPEGGFAYQLVEHPKGEEITLGTAITCQRGNGVLKLSYWLSNPAEIDFKVCTQDHIARSCTQPIAYSSASTVVVEVVHPNATVFDVEVVVANIMHPLLFVVDSLEYRADLCEDEKQPASSPSGKTAAAAKSSSSFFDDDSAVPSVPSGGSAASGTSHKKDPRQTRGEELEEKQEDENRSDRAFHARPTVLNEQFQVDPADYDHEASVPASEDVAYENSISDGPAPPSAPRDPFKGVRMGDAAEDKPTFPPSAEPSEDGIEPIVNSKSRRLRIRRLSVCNLLECNFDRDLCNYGNFMNASGTFGPWSLGNKPVGNVHTGIKNIKDGAGFLYVGTDATDEHAARKRDYVLESPQFILPEDTPLSFDVYRRSNDIALKVCFDTLMNCPYSVPPLEKEVYWKEGETVIVPKTARKIFFVATQKKRFKWLAIDNIQLRSDRC